MTDTYAKLDPGMEPSFWPVRCWDKRSRRFSSWGAYEDWLSANPQPPEHVAHENEYMKALMVRMCLPEGIAEEIIAGMGWRTTPPGPVLRVVGDEGDAHL